MLSIAGQTAGPIGLKFFVDTHGWRRGECDSLKKILSLFSKTKNFKFFFPQATPGPSAS